MKAIIFGCGYYWNNVEEFSLMDTSVEICGFIDNNPHDNILHPEALCKLNFDKVIICNINDKDKLEMMNQLIDMGIDISRISFIEEFHKCYQCRIQALGKNHVLIEKNNIKIECHNDIELMIAREVLAGGMYDYHSKSKCYVIDIGMNIGTASLFFANKDNVVSVYGFEPSEYAFQHANDNFNLNPSISHKLHSFPYGLGAGGV